MEEDALHQMEFSIKQSLSRLVEPESDFDNIAAQPAIYNKTNLWSFKKSPIVDTKLLSDELESAFDGSGVLCSQESSLANERRIVYDGLLTLPLSQSLFDRLSGGDDMFVVDYSVLLKNSDIGSAALRQRFRWISSCCAGSETLSHHGRLLVVRSTTMPYNHPEWGRRKRLCRKTAIPEPEWMCAVDLSCI